MQDAIKSWQVTKMIDCIKNCERIDILHRDANRAMRYELGITTIEQEAFIKSLEKEDFIKGPDDDYDINWPGKVYVFKKRLKGIPIYIKIKEPDNFNEVDRIKCLSCHIDQN